MGRSLKNISEARLKPLTLSGPHSPVLCSLKFDQKPMFQLGRMGLLPKAPKVIGSRTGHEGPLLRNILGLGVTAPRALLWAQLCGPGGPMPAGRTAVESRQGSRLRCGARDQTRRTKKLMSASSNPQALDNSQAFPPPLPPLLPDSRSCLLRGKAGHPGHVGQSPG